jgi:hypothetical protein
VYILRRRNIIAPYPNKITSEEETIMANVSWTNLGNGEYTSKAMSFNREESKHCPLYITKKFVISGPRVDIIKWHIIKWNKEASVYAHVGYKNTFKAVKDFVNNDYDQYTQLSDEDKGMSVATW